MRVKREEYFDKLQKELVTKCQDAEKSTKPYTCQSAIDYHYRRCMADQYESWECEKEVYETMERYCADKTKNDICKAVITSTTLSTSTPTTTKTTTPPTTTAPIIKSSHIITVGAICGMILIFGLILLICCCCQKRRERKRREKEEEWHIPGWTSSTTSEGSKKSGSGEWAYGLSGMMTAKEKTDMKTAKSKTSSGLFGESKKPKSTKESGSWDYGLSGVMTAKEKTDMKTASSGLFGKSKKPEENGSWDYGLSGVMTAKENTNMNTAKSKTSLFGKSKEPKSAKPSSPATPISPGTPTPKATVEKSKKRQHTGNTATIRPLVWNKQAAQNTYY